MAASNRRLMRDQHHPDRRPPRNINIYITSIITYHADSHGILGLSLVLRVGGFDQPVSFTRSGRVDGVALEFINHLAQALHVEEGAGKEVTDHVAFDVEEFANLQADVNEDEGVQEEACEAKSHKSKDIATQGSKDNPHDEEGKVQNRQGNLAEHAEVELLADAVDRVTRQQETNEELLDLKGIGHVEPRGDTILVRVSKRDSVFANVSNTSKEMHLPALVFRTGELPIVIASRLLLAVGLTHTDGRVHHKEQKEVERHTEDNGSGLQSAQSLRSSRHKKSSCDSTFSEGPEHTLQPMVVFVSVGGKMVDNERTGIRGRDEVNRQGDQRKSGHEATEATPVIIRSLGETERIHDVEPSGCHVARVVLADGGNSRDTVSEGECLLVLGQTGVGQGHGFLRDIKANRSIGICEMQLVAKVLVSKVFELVGLTSLAQSNTTKGTEPKQGIHERSQEGINHDLTNSASAGDASEEEADKGTPSCERERVKNTV